jgi:PAS domain S-box-containing protein
VRHLLTDLVAPDVRAEDLLAAVLDATAQPICVVDGDGVIRFANASAVAALGYGEVAELLARDCDATIHDHRPDDAPAADSALLRPLTTGKTARSELDWFVRQDGSRFPVSYVSAPIALREGRGVVVSFADVTDRLRTEQALQQHDSVLATREAALRRIAALVVQGATSGDLFAAIAEEVAAVMDVPLVVVWHIYTGGGGHVVDRPALVVGAWGERPHPFRDGSAWAVEEEVAEAMVPGIDRPVRVEDFAAVGGEVAAAIAGAGIRAGAGAAIVVDGEAWGSMGVGATRADEPLREGIEHELAEFTHLISTTISNSENRERLTHLAAEQAALRRVATLVARAAALRDVLDAAALEVGMLLDVVATRVTRFAPDGAHDEVAVWHGHEEEDEGEAVTAPIAVDQRPWGALVVSWGASQTPPTDAEARIAAFTDLIATAISNAEAREEVAASRARIVAAADDERRRVVRDLHDGAQQRLVHTVVTLKLAQSELSAGGDAAVLVTEALEQAEQATVELRELAHGILPAVLTRGGLSDGVDALAARMPVPVGTEVAVERLPAVVESTAYFVVAEALTNVAKHARATRAEVSARVEGGRLRVEVRDDGVGGARPDGGGLVGLADRLDVLGGRLSVESPGDGGTLIAAEIPVPG